MRISLELVAGEGFDPPRLGGNVEILLGTESFNFGDPQNGKYLKFDADSRKLEPGKVELRVRAIWLLDWFT